MAMTNRKVEQLAKKMYMVVSSSKYSYFKQCFVDGKKVKWADLDFEQFIWKEMAYLALISIDKINDTKKNR